MTGVAVIGSRRMLSFLQTQVRYVLMVGCVAFASPRRLFARPGVIVIFWSRKKICVITQIFNCSFSGRLFQLKFLPDISSSNEMFIYFIEVFMQSCNCALFVLVLRSWRPLSRHERRVCMQKPYVRFYLCFNGSNAHDRMSLFQIIAQNVSNQ